MDQQTHAQHFQKSLNNTNVNPEPAANKEECVLNQPEEKVELTESSPPKDQETLEDNKLNEEKTREQDDKEPETNDESKDSSKSPPEKWEPNKIQRERSARYAYEKEGQTKVDHEQFESERSMPWLRMNPHDQNLSEQMFLYLTHQEIMHKIEDLEKRESHACLKHSWDEALHLRDMKNQLELIREKRIFNMCSLKMDEEARSLGLTSIDKRAEQLAQREKACTTSNMYSEEAKELWKQWVHEDERSPIRDARLRRENVLKDLEEEWRNLAIEEKDKISRSFGKTIQDDLNIITTANHRKTKSVLHPSV